jgi:hypothetical protein
MSPLTNKRWKFLGGMLTLSLIAAAWLSSSDGDATEVVEAAKPVHVQALRSTTLLEGQQPEPQNDIRLEKLRRQESGQSVKDVFLSKSWYVAPPPPAPAPPPPPMAPALPFVFLGKLVEGDGKVTVFISAQDRYYSVKEGDIIDSTYQVGAIKGSLMELTYMPLKMTQTLHIGEQN